MKITETTGTLVTQLHNQADAVKQQQGAKMVQHEAVVQQQMENQVTKMLHNVVKKDDTGKVQHAKEKEEEERKKRKKNQHYNSKGSMIDRTDDDPSQIDITV